jgi:HPr kinase/phosphorylase
VKDDSKAPSRVVETRPIKGISADQLLAEKGTELGLEPLTTCLKGRLPITVSDVNRPGLCLAGFRENFLYERIQILGETEVLFLNTLTEESRRQAISRLLDYDLPVIIVTKSLTVPPFLLATADEKGTPVFRTPLSTTPFIHQLASYLADVFAARAMVHGSLVDVYGVGLLITGKSGIGKSECALDLVERGHRLVADDMVVITRGQKGLLLGTSNERLQYHMEIRGIGIIDVRSMFGIRAIRPRKQIDVEVVLREWGANVEYDRLGLDEEKRAILGVKIPQVAIPIVPGKNITVVAEVVALNYLLKAHGVHSAARLNESLIRGMKNDREWLGGARDASD